MKTVAVLLPALAASACLLHADPFVIGGATYTAGGPSEIVAVDFTQSNGGSTSNQYYGFVRLTVSGVGQSLGTAFNDAFYVYTDGAGNPIAPFNDVNFYQLAIDTAPLVGSPGNPTNPIHNARLHTFFDVFADIEVAPLYVPAFQANHVYDFIISVPSLNSYLGGLSTLNFGVSNGIFADNSGAYQIQVQQLVPEPGSVVLLATAMALALGVRRYRRR